MAGEVFTKEYIMFIMKFTKNMQDCDFRNREICWLKRDVFSQLVRKSADVTKIDMAAVSVLTSDEYAICESLLEISSNFSTWTVFLSMFQKYLFLLKINF